MEYTYNYYHQQAAYNAHDCTDAANCFVSSRNHTMLKRQLISGLKCITKQKSNLKNLQNTNTQTNKKHQTIQFMKGWKRLMAFTISILHFVPACNTIFEFGLSHQFVSFFKFIINAFGCIFVIAGPIEQCL